MREVERRRPEVHFNEDGIYFNEDGIYLKEDDYTVLYRHQSFVS